MNQLFDYEIVYQHIFNLVKSLNEHDKIPSENELCEKFNITRSTARQGILQLKNEGIIYSKKGSGNFVNPKKIRYELTKNTTFTGEIKKSNKTPSLKILNSSIIKSDEIISKKLSIEENSEIVKVDMLRFVDDIPFSTTNSYLNLKVLPNIDKEIYNFSSLTELFKEIYEIKTLRNHSELEVVPQSKNLITTLQIQNLLPLIKISSTSYDVDSKNIVEYCESYFRSDRAQIVINYSGE